MSFFDSFSQKHLVFDGGMGTMLQAAGLPAGASPDVWNITNPDACARFMLVFERGRKRDHLQHLRLHRARQSAAHTSRGTRGAERSHR
jgi:hypothetical protein